MQDLRRLGTGSSGLSNCGNTCYLNAVVQALAHCPDLMAFCDAANYRLRLNANPQASVLVEFDKIRILLWRRDHSVVPNRLVEAIQSYAGLRGDKEMAASQQCDAHEFLVLLLDTFHDAISRPVEMCVAGQPVSDRDRLAQKCYNHMKEQYDNRWSEFVPLFTIVQVTSLSLLEGSRQVSQNCECNTILSLPIPEDSSDLIDVLKAYTAPEPLIGNNAWYDDKTQRRLDVHRQTSFWSLPDTLIIQFVRWTSDLRKLRTAVSFPRTVLDMSSFVIGYRPHESRYTLSAVVYHHGGPNGGHYTCSARVLRGIWMHFNDRVVKQINPEQLCSADAYLLFYTKIK